MGFNSGFKGLMHLVQTGHGTRTASWEPAAPGHEDDRSLPHTTGLRMRVRTWSRHSVDTERRGDSLSGCLSQPV